MESVHRFYAYSTIRSVRVYRILRKAAFDGGERKRQAKEAKSFLKPRLAQQMG